jgi:uncharacterized protein
MRGTSRTASSWLHRRRLRARLAGLWLGIVSLTPAAALEVPFLSGRVNDYADLLSAEAEQRIVARLSGFEQARGSQVVVLTILSLEGEALEEFSLRVAETWALGRKEVDDGVLLLVARDDRKMRIEVGYGLEHQLTNAQSGRILRNVLRPRFQNGDFDGGIEEAVNVIIGTLEGADVIPPDETGGQHDLPVRLGIFAFFLAVISVFAMTAIFSSGCNSWFLYVFLMPFFGAFPSALLHPKAGIIAVGGWAILFPVMKFLLRKTDFGKRWTEEHPGWTNWSGGGGGGGFSGGGFSGGGFSGGGGSFGGGGASGSW